MRVLTVPNWSFGRDKDLLRKFRECFPTAGLTLHYLESDVDHNRTVAAFSGEVDLVLSKLLELCNLALGRIDLNRHVGVHPRTGGLDVCPFVSLPEWEVPFDQLESKVEAFSAQIAEQFELPVFLYEKSERGRHEADLPSLRRGGFGGLSGRELKPDFGPKLAHPRLGITILGVREFLIAMNINLETEDLTLARELANVIRTGRQEGDPRFIGVRALGFPLASRQLTQVSLNLTLPDSTAADPIIEWVMFRAERADVRVSGTELIGVVRERDLAGASRLPIKEEQIVDHV